MDAKKSNETVLNEEKINRPPIKSTRQRTGNFFFGYIMRRERLQPLMTNGILNGKRSRCRQREKSLDGLAKWLGTGKVMEMEIFCSTERSRTVEGRDRQRLIARHLVMKVIPQTFNMNKNNS
ncbi:hypothetical protein ElyMa_005743500 [Elysia marginata]|uniref:Uncharacterized protein n=1 Tax=Elysia marginata TaxID=1093978 RepID=A0AAV4FNR8_9GAST|nr:hypothetical protein ElyMa_005743500 [Elysia marginata]